MKPIEFDGSNAVFAKDQPQYLPLPAYRDPDGHVVSCWKLNWKERLQILLGFPLWLSQLTFNAPLQPQRPTLEKPFNLMADTMDAELPAPGAYKI